MHPTLLTNAAGVARARQRCRSEKWASKVLDELLEQARKLSNQELPIFDTDWWSNASRKPWAQTYPEVSKHTYSDIQAPCATAKRAAMAYAASGDKSAAQAAVRVLMHYSDYEFIAEHPDVGMNWSIWCTNLLQAYDLVHDEVCPDGRTRIDGFFSAALDAIRRNDDWWLRDGMGGRFNNHFAWHKLFIGSYGIFYKRDELVDYAVNGSQAARELIEYGSRDDGIWFESSINYHFAAVAPLVQFAGELANSESGVDLWHTRLANGCGLRDLVTGPLQTLFPDRTLPSIGDCYASRKKLESSDLYYAAYDACVLPEIAWLLSGPADIPPLALFLQNLPSDPAAPAPATRDWPEHGYVFLRTEEGTDYWNGRGFSVFLSRDLDSIHSHRDKFDLIAYGRSAHLALDVEARSTPPHAFSSRVTRELNRSTLCHNTVMVDHQDHRPIRAKLELAGFVNGPEIKLATVTDYECRVHPGVRMSRTVAAVPEYILDVFQVSSDEEHVYDYLFHTYSDTGKLDLGVETSPASLPKDGPWRWLKNPRSAGFDCDFTAASQQGDVKVRLTVAGCAGTQAITCDFPGKDDFSMAPVPMLIVRRRARQTTFVTVLQAETGDVPSLNIRQTEDRHGFVRISVECSGSTREFAVPSIGIA